MTLRLPGHLAFTSLAVISLVLVQPAIAQDEHESAGFGWPMADQEGHQAVGAGSGGAFGGEAIAAQNGEVPDGVEQLERDIFTSDDFYQDAELWSDPRYFRCNSPMGLESQWGAYGNAIIGDNPPESGAWGFCDADYPRADIISPYPFATGTGFIPTRARTGSGAASFRPQRSCRCSPPNTRSASFRRPIIMPTPTLPCGPANIAGLRASCAVGTSILSATIRC